MKLFLRDISLRPSCYDCKFKNLSRPSDITLGDLWNYNIYPKEHSKGISTVIIHSKTGEKLLLDSNINMKNIEWYDSINYCKRIVLGKTPIFLPRRMLIYNSKKMKLNRFKKLYCMSMKVTDIDLFVFKVYRFLIMKTNTAFSKIYIKYLLKKNKKYLNSIYRGEKDE